MSVSAKVLAQGSVKPALAAGVLRIYGMRFCPFVRRVLLVLNAKNIPHEVVNIHLKDKPDWFLALNPEGKVPVLEQDDKLLGESLIIADYLDDAYLGEKLWSTDPYQRARGRLVIEQLGKIIGQFRAMYVDKSVAAFDQSLVELKFFEDKLASENTTFFSGDKVGMIDYMAWPMINILLEMWEVGIYTGEPILCTEHRPKLTAWVERMRQNAAVQSVSLPHDIEIQFKKSVLTGVAEYDLGL